MQYTYQLEQLVGNNLFKEFFFYMCSAENHRGTFLTHLCCQILLEKKNNTKKQTNKQLEQAHNKLKSNRVILEVRHIQIYSDLHMPTLLTP